jgi:flagellar motor switch protein FliM
MSPVLSQNEVDALLNAVMDGDLEEVIEEEEVEEAPSGSASVSTGAAIPGTAGYYRAKVKLKAGEVRPYDITNQDRVMRGKMPMLEVLHDKFCRDFRTLLSMDLRRMVDVEAGKIELVKFRDFLNELPVPSCLSLFTMEPLTGNGLITFDSELIFVLVDIFCGGQARKRFRVEGREFTGIEQGIVKKVVERAAEQIEETWDSLHPVKVAFARSEVNPQFVNIAHPTEVVVTFKADIDIEGNTGWMTIVLPYSMIEPIKKKLSKGVIGDRADFEKKWRDGIRQKVHEAEIELTSVLGFVELSIGRLLDMNEGDIIELDTYLDDPVILHAEGKPKFTARSGTFKGNKAVQVLEPLT